MSTLVQQPDYAVAYAEPSARATFIRRTYTHLAGAVGLFVLLEYYLIRSPIAEAMLQFIGANQYGWLMFLGAFILVGWLARGLAQGVASVPLQYAGLGLYVAAEALLFVPLIYLAAFYSDPTVLPMAGILTIALFAGLTFTAVITQKDFSFLGTFLTVGGFLALGLIVAGAIFGFNLGLVFSFAMVGLACGAILYDTSKVLHHYDTTQYVAASLEIFASVALLFWYILRIVMRLSRR